MWLIGQYFAEIHIIIKEVSDPKCETTGRQHFTYIVYTRYHIILQCIVGVFNESINNANII